MQAVFSENIQSSRHGFILSFQASCLQMPPPVSIASLRAIDRRKMAMDLSYIANKLGISDAKPLLQKAQELRRLCDAHFHSSVIRVGEVCKGTICLDIAASRMQILFNRKEAIRLSGMSVKAYNRSFQAIHNSLGVKAKLDPRELGIRFGCVRLIPLVQKGLSLYKDRYLAALPVCRRPGADFDRPVFTAAAFYLCAKKFELKIDKVKLIQICSSTEYEFTNVSTYMSSLCSDVFGTTSEKKNIKATKGGREHLDACHDKRKLEEVSNILDASSLDDEDNNLLPRYKRHKRMDKCTSKELQELKKILQANEANLS